MKVIALRGPVNTGKSHTINIVYQFLLKDGWTQVPNNFRILGNPNFEDIIDILTKDGILLGIIGIGDYQKGLNSTKRLLQEITTKGCSIAICSCRNIAGIEKAIMAYPLHIFVDKTLSTGLNNNRLVNFTDSQEIMKLI